MTSVSKTSKNIKKLVCVAMFCAIAYIVSFIFPIKVQFLTFDAKDAVIAVGGMFLGPLSALIMSVIVPLLEFISISDTGIYGLIMNFLSSATFSVTASLVYKYRRKMSGAVIALLSAVLATCTVMFLANLFITPYYMGVPRDTVIELLPTLILPFNLTKSLLNSGLVLLIYKPFTTALKATKLVHSDNTNKISPMVTLITAISAVIILSLAVFVYIFVLGGSVSFFGK